MAAPKLVTALVAFTRCLNEARSLAADAQQWAVPRKAGGRAQITTQRRDTLTEIAFLRAFTGWEVFLEETFLLFLVGHKAPKAPRPIRFGFPANLSAASEWCTDGKEYAKWNVSDVRRRADRWLDQGKPFSPVLQGRQARLDQLITIRNAIAHESSVARTKFENLVRNELPTVPAAMSVGSFLITVVPAITPPITYMDFYLDQVESAAMAIVPR
jgi:hypothetical protein